MISKLYLYTALWLIFLFITTDSDALTYSNRTTSSAKSKVAGEVHE